MCLQEPAKAEVAEVFERMKDNGVLMGKVGNCSLNACGHWLLARKECAHRLDRLANEHGCLHGRRVLTGLTGLQMSMDVCMGGVCSQV